MLHRCTGLFQSIMDILVFRRKFESKCEAGLHNYLSLDFGALKLIFKRIIIFCPLNSPLNIRNFRADFVILIIKLSVLVILIIVINLVLLQNLFKQELLFLKFEISQLFLLICLFQFLFCL